MECKVCGRKIANEEAHFCEYCGASLRDKTMPGTATSYTARDSVAAEGAQDKNIYGNVQFSGEQGMQGRPAENINSGMERPITFKGWIGIMLLPFIPMIGTFIYLVILFVWAFGSTGSQTRKGWARATLLMLFISVILLTALMPSVIGGISK